MAVSGRVVGTHRIAYWRETGHWPAGLDVCHRCDVRTCCNPAHLFAGTRADNMQDAAAKGRLSVAHRSAEVRAAIRACRDAGMSIRQIAKRFGYQGSPSLLYTRPRGRRAG